MELDRIRKGLIEKFMMLKEDNVMVVRKISQLSKENDIIPILKSEIDGLEGKLHVNLVCNLYFS